jgi:hypothetical protein
MGDLDQMLSQWLTRLVVGRVIEYVFEPDTGTYVVLDNGGRRWTIKITSEDEE